MGLLWFLGLLRLTEVVSAQVLVKGPLCPLTGVLGWEHPTIPEMPTLSQGTGLGILGASPIPHFCRPV